MNEITLFYATNNKSKLHNMRYRLRNYPIHVICPDDLDIHLSVEENGETVSGNALLKADAYYEHVHMPVVAGDTGVYIDGLDKDMQPGLFVRRVNGKTLSDDEMIEHYRQIAENVGGQPYIHYVTGIALITESGAHTTEISDSPLHLTSIPNNNRKHRGNPLDVITLTEDGRYFNELTDEERIAFDSVGEKLFTDFIVNNLI